jgi:outer membrane protein
MSIPISISTPLPRALLLALWFVAWRPAPAACQQWDIEADSAVKLGPRLPLETIIAQTLAHSPSVAGAVGAVRTTSAAQRVAIGAYLPSLALTSTATSTDQSAGSGGSSTAQNAYGAGVAALVDVFTGGRRSAQRVQANALSRAAGAGLVLQRYATVFLATQGYLDVLRAHELVRVTADEVAQAGLGLQYAQRRESAGTATRADVLSAQLAVSTARQALLAATDTLVMNAAALGRLVGANGPVDAEPAATIEPAPLAMSDSAVIALAIATAPAVVTTQAVASADTAAVRAAKTLYVPTITAGAGYNWAMGATSPQGLRPGWIMTLGTTFPLFDGFQREATITQAEAAAYTTSSTAADTRLLVRADAQRLLGNLHVAENSIGLSRESVRLATENLRLFRARYGAGIATILDVLTAQTSLIQVELSLVSAQFNYQSTRAALESLLGQRL